MKHLTRFLLTSMSLFLFANSFAQTADEIISKHIEATGGKEKIKSVTSLKLDNTMTVMGNDAPSTSTLVVGKGLRVESDFNGQKMVQVVTDKGGWAINPMGGGIDPQAIPDDMYKQVKDQLNYSPFTDYPSNGSKATLTGKEKVGTADAYKVDVTNKDNLVTSYFIDPSTYYIVKMVKKATMMGQEMEVSTTYSDFKKTDFGVTVPFTTEIDYGGQFQMTSKLKKAEFNTPVDASIFEMKK
jgi:hypothetical protein